MGTETGTGTGTGEGEEDAGRLEGWKAESLGVLEQAGRHASKCEMQRWEHEPEQMSKCGVMLALALGGCCAVLCCAIGCVLRWGWMSRRTVGRSVDSLFWRARVIRLFSLSLSISLPLARGGRSRIRGGNSQASPAWRLSACVSAGKWAKPVAPPLSKSALPGAIPI